MKEEAVASQDETPTDRPTTPGEPQNGAAESAPAGPDNRIGSRSGSHSARAAGAAGAAGPASLPGPDEHADWDAEFNSLAGSAESTGSAGDAGDGRDAGKREDASSPAGPDTEPAETGQPDAEHTEAGTPDTEHAEAGTPDAVSADTDSPAAVVPTTALPATVQRPATEQRPDPEASPSPHGTETVPGGHPSLAQRSELPMRRASTLPDLSGVARPGDRKEGTADAGEPAESGSPVPGAAVTAAAVSADHHQTDRSSADTNGHADDALPNNEDPENTDRNLADTENNHPDDSDPEDTDPEDTDRDPADQDGAAVSPEQVERRAKEREKAAAGKPVLARVLQVMIAVFFPVMVLAAAIRAVATPLFLWAEYHRPGFPEDAYGFSRDDRMTYGSYAVDYLSNLSGARYLGDLMGGGGEPLYLASEVSHMADVKTVLTAAFTAAAVMLLLSLAAALYLRRRSPGGIRRSLFAGALVTLALMAVLVVLAVLGWEQFFTQVHSIFFANGNWTFRLDDTLIRLFPAQFWMDAGIVIAALVLLTCAAVLACCWPTKARRERVRQAREDARRRYAESLNAL
ncbi:TIGR01906 family membrane protein [Arthrobacter sp. zg-Y40]|uniref:TIGR01906 family membrane protein n=1 Tax=Arthrobacter sp. zg-Y40 TaxID=2886939 RepID=UPI001D13FB2E|nr:TIGR01906 family membrane protein [Arthrobacter sp. zg-Y40]